MKLCTRSYMYGFEALDDGPVIIHTDRLELSQPDYGHALRVLARAKAECSSTLRAIPEFHIHRERWLEP